MRIRLHSLGGEMNYFIAFMLLVLQISYRPSFALGESNKIMCPFRDTVNLTNQKMLMDGSYFYQGILIPPEKQQQFDYELKFLGEKKTVEPHIRGCICDQKPCIKLCCAQGEFLDEKKTINQCEKVTHDMKVSWNLALRQSTGREGIRDVLKHFVYQVGFPCDQPKAMIKEDKAVLFEVCTCDFKLNLPSVPKIRA